MISLYHKISGASSKMITKEYSTSFSIAVSLLGPSIRQAIYNIYGFVRVADEIVDSFLAFPQEELLSRFEEELYYALDKGISPNPVLHAFQQTVKEYNIDLELIQAFLKSMRADLSKEKYHTDDEMREYVYGSADVVGLMCLKVFVYGDEEKYNKLKESAMKLGSAFQEVNFLRDLNHDYTTLNRTYFPDIDPERLTEVDKIKLIEGIKEEFEIAYEGIKGLPDSSKLGVYVAYKYFSALLFKIKRTPADILINKRIRISNFYKLILIFKSYLAYRFKRI